MTTARPRRRASVAGVIGELLITGGVLVMLFVTWQLWVGDLIAGAQNNTVAHELAEQWDTLPLPPQTPDVVEQEPAAIEPVISPEPADGEVFGIMYVPRFGPDFAVRMGGGVSRTRTLDTIGIGHYPGTQMPGEVGNFAVAAHRTGFGGAPFLRIAELRVGDPIIVETADGWYTYRFRTMEYVRPSETEVLHPVPKDTIATSNGRYLTMTSCSPKHTIMERIVAYSVFESFQPRAAGEPEVLTAAGEL